LQLSSAHFGILEAHKLNHLELASSMENSMKPSEPPRRLFNTDGTPMASRLFDIKGKAFGQPSTPKPPSPPPFRPPPPIKPFGKR